MEKKTANISRSPKIIALETVVGAIEQFKNVVSVFSSILYVFVASEMMRKEIKVAVKCRKYCIHIMHVKKEATNCWVITNPGWFFW